jgi:hypothetical protein
MHASVLRGATGVSCVMRCSHGRMRGWLLCIGRKGVCCAHIEGSEQEGCGGAGRGGCEERDAGV